MRKTKYVYITHPDIDGPVKVLAESLKAWERVGWSLQVQKEFTLDSTQNVSTQVEADTSANQED